MNLPDTSAMTELVYWIGGRESDPEKARTAAERLHAAIAKDVIDAEHLRLRAEATNQTLVDEMRRESTATKDMLSMIQGFAKGRGDDTGRRIYLAIIRFYLEAEDREPGLLRIPPELVEPAPPIFESKPRQQEDAA
ncbi:hypothetical protein OG785_45310 [Streptomyces sp. NBC_00006]|uniref:hypothetical protein n=1 Tax=Streptomyces sp. NBC_00006 TaxID=2975619 RepID=UPI00224E024D|nr:hypothetical protein [Streptomyces sp. NBC_00006]MCX5528989.1 hypothetical protein [Streptomyces sp. NBC_00006]MCX5537779.1 hypothetical protein [Streptomyces sp. NBC_00006]